MAIWIMQCTNKRERVKETSGSNANTRICSEVRAPSSTSPPTPPCRISNPLVHRGLPPREPSPRRIFTTRENRTPFSQIQPHRRGTTTIHLYRRGIRPVANTITNYLCWRGIQTKLHLSLEGANTTPINLYQRGIYKYKEGLQQVVSFNHKLSFPQKQGS